MKKMVLPLLAILALLCTSCRSLKIFPTATNSVGTVAFGELNLERSDYYVYNTLTEIAKVRFEQNFKDYTIREEKNEFSYDFGFDKLGHAQPSDIEGVIKLGAITNTASASFDFTDAGDIARRLAIYRLNASAAAAGADYIIEPVVSMNIKKEGRHVVIFEATATAKLVKIKKIDD